MLTNDTRIRPKITFGTGKPPVWANLVKTNAGLTGGSIRYSFRSKLESTEVRWWCWILRNMEICGVKRKDVGEGFGWVKPLFPVCKSLSPALFSVYRMWDVQVHYSRTYSWKICWLGKGSPVISVVSRARLGATDIHNYRGRSRPHLRPAPSVSITPCEKALSSNNHNKLLIKKVKLKGLL